LTSLNLSWMAAEKKWSREKIKKALRVKGKKNVLCSPAQNATGLGVELGKRVVPSAGACATRRVRNGNPEICRIRKWAEESRIEKVLLGSSRTEERKWKKKDFR